MLSFLRCPTRPNGAILREKVASALLRQADRPGLLAVLLVELAMGEPDNDSAGRKARGEVLDAAMDRLDSVLRWSETPTRVGFDLFVVVCPGLPDAGVAGLIASRIVAAFERPVQVSSAAVSVMPRVGVAVADPGDSDPQRVIARADTAMRRVGRTSGAGYTFAAEHRHASAVH